jgi:hypothetical protein
LVRCNRCNDEDNYKVYDTKTKYDTVGNWHIYDPGNPEYPRNEALEYGKHYHWHVRYKGSNGEWGPWSGDLPEPHQDFYTHALAVTLNRADKSELPTIAICLSVNDLSGNVMADLDASNFAVKENGNVLDQFDVSPLSPCSLTISVALALDFSNSMNMGDGQPIQNLRNAAQTFLGQLNLETPNQDDSDAVEIIKFSSQFCTPDDPSGVKVVQHFTKDKTALSKAIEEGYVWGQTPLYNAISRAVTDTAAQSGQQAVIVMTDGYDNSYGDPRGDTSREQLERMIRHAQRSGVPVYTIGLGNRVLGWVLEKIASETSGKFYFTPTSDGLEEIYINIAETLKDQYRLTYETSIQRPKRLTMEVQVNIDDKFGKGRKLFVLEPAIPMPWLLLLLDD